MGTRIADEAPEEALVTNPLPLATEEKLVVLAGSAHPTLADAVARHLGVRLGPYGAMRFPDGELDVRVDDLRGLRAVLVQPMPHPAGDSLLELLLLADACRRAGARSVTAVVPYMGYARQDHRTVPGQALAMRVVADLLGARRVDRILAVDLHSDTIEGFFDGPLEHVSAVPVLAEAVRATATRGSVIVAPDLGAAKRAREYARALELPMAIVRKTRLGPLDVSADALVGDVRGFRPILVDDMISTGVTLDAAVRVLRAERCAAEITVVATHGVFVESAADRLRSLDLKRIVVSDTLPLPASMTGACDVVSLAPRIAEVVRRVVIGQST